MRYMAMAWMTCLALMMCLALPAILFAEVVDRVMCPPGWCGSLIYYQSFDAEDGGPEINAAKVEVRGKVALQAGGMHGRLGEGANGLQLVSGGVALSPHRPLTISLWWALPEDLPQHGGFELIGLQGRGFISHFARGGPWCGLQDTAGVVQIYHLPNINDVNGVYDTSLRQTLDLRKKQWHHTAMVIAGGSLVSVYTDGKLAFESRAAGRTFSIEDGFRTIRLGGGVLLDEIMVLNRPVAEEEIGEYVRGFQQMRMAYGGDQAREQ